MHQLNNLPPQALNADVVVVRPETEILTRQALPNFVGISAASAGSSAICMNMVIIPPGGAAEPHLHLGYETAIYVIQGQAETRYGLNLEKSIHIQAGEFMFIPANLPHQPINHSNDTPCIAIVARNDANEQEHVYLLD